jgi:hypothetical protein
MDQVKESILSQESTALAAEITDAVRNNLPNEKAIAARQMEQTGKELRSGIAPTAGDGRGQPILSIPPIVYMRWQQEYPGCWQDKGFCAEFAFDNPQCVPDGYKPRAKRLFHQMKHGNMKIGNPGGDLYHERRAKVNAAIQAQIKAS